MRKNIKLLYSSDEIYKYFERVLNVDHYDYLTMQNYLEKYYSNLSVDNLNTMLDTLKNDSESNSHVHSISSNTMNSIISLISIGGAVFVAIFVGLISYLLSKDNFEVIAYIERFGKGVSLILLVYLSLVGGLFLNSMSKSRKFNRLQKLIKIFIAIKTEKEQ